MAGYACLTDQKLVLTARQSSFEISVLCSNCSGVELFFFEERSFIQNKLH
jgi:hypothetical protein